MEDTHFVILSTEDEDADDLSNTRVSSQKFKLSTLYAPNMNDCVDAILENKHNHLEMLHELELATGMSKRDLENNKYIIRHRTKSHKIDSYCCNLAG